MHGNFSKFASLVAVSVPSLRITPAKLLEQTAAETKMLKQT
jgi:hypothetical protein